MINMPTPSFDNGRTSAWSADHWPLTTIENQEIDIFDEQSMLNAAIDLIEI